jgi:hypothetical protein
LTILAKLHRLLSLGLAARKVRKPLEGKKSADDQAIAGLDQSLTTITALLRITEIENSRRREGFSEVQLAPLIHEVGDLYDPIAEDKGVTIRVDVSFYPKSGSRNRQAGTSTPALNGYLPQRESQPAPRPQSRLGVKSARLSPSQFPDSSDKGVTAARRLSLAHQLRQLRIGGFALAASYPERALKGHANTRAEFRVIVMSQTGAEAWD